MVSLYLIRTVKASRSAARVMIQIAASTYQETDAMDLLVMVVNSIRETSMQTSTSFREAGL